MWMKNKAGIHSETHTDTNTRMNDRTKTIEWEWEAKKKKRQIIKINLLTNPWKINDGKKWSKY